MKQFGRHKYHLVTLLEMAEKLRSKHFIFINRNLEDVDFIRPIIPAADSGTNRIDISVWGFTDVMLISTNRSLVPKSPDV